ncbi:hypothetical protein V6N11_071581 [Hibiscus sabdariffa]|uniref:Uncharacterized protein n=1 Tax=Hibiscus sabdariffa TaxID=183260 RepID=A0ABR2U183_9ROSI
MAVFPFSRWHGRGRLPEYLVSIGCMTSIRNMFVPSPKCRVGSTRHNHHGKVSSSLCFSGGQQTSLLVHFSVTTCGAWLRPTLGFLSASCTPCFGCVLPCPLALPLRGPAHPFLPILDRPPTLYALQPHTPDCVHLQHGPLLHSAPPQCASPSRMVWCVGGRLCVLYRAPCDLHRWSLRAPPYPWLAPYVPVCDLRTPLCAWQARASTDLHRPIPGS